MITRGYCLGYIVDELSEIQNKVILRNSLGLTDAAKVLENFYCEILNIIEPDANYKNTNTDISNAEAVDLISDANKRVIQITSSLSSEKILNTLELWAASKTYSTYKIQFLSIGKRQKTYSSKEILEAEKKFNLKISDLILDNKTLASNLLNLETKELYSAYELVKANSAKITINLEITADGEEPIHSRMNQYTSKSSFQFTGIKAFLKEMESNKGGSLDQREINDYNESFSLLIKVLTDIPRQSRELLAICFSEVLNANDYRKYLRTQPRIIAKKSSFTEDEIHNEIILINNITKKYQVNFCDIELDDDDNTYYLLFYSFGEADNFFRDILHFLKHDTNLIKTTFARLNFEHFD